MKMNVFKIGKKREGERTKENEITIYINAYQFKQSDLMYNLHSNKVEYFKSLRVNIIKMLLLLEWFGNDP